MINIEIGQILTQIVAFLFMYWILKKFAWKPLLAIMEERKQKIESEFEFIEQQKREIQHLNDEYNAKLKDIDAKARVKIQEGIDKGYKLAREIQEEARVQAKNIISHTQDEVVKEIAKAKIQMKKEIIHLTIEATKKLLKEEIDEKKQESLIDKFLEEAELK